MWEVREGDRRPQIYFCYDTSATKTSRKHCPSQHYSLRILFKATLFTNKHVLRIIKFLYHSTSIIEHAQIFLKSRVCSRN